MIRSARIVAAALVAVTSACCAPLAVAEEPAQSLADAIADGSATFGLRYRYEFVDQDSFAKDANASTLRVRLNYETADWKRWTGFVEFDHVLEVFLNDYNSGGGTSGPNRAVYPVVADPDGPDLNQLYLQYAQGDQWRTRIGRQRINFDDQRFVGGVGWRQNEQTYDSLSFKYDGFSRTSVTYAYVANVARIFGTSVPAGDHEQNTHLLNVNVGVADDFKIIGYAYLIDNDDMPSFSTNTFGLRAEAGTDLGGGRLALLADIATQSDAGNAPVSFDANYVRLQGIWKAGALSAGLGFESLGSDNGQGFRTPLATLHAFNGWADLFLSTPPNGLEDFYLRLGYQLKPWNLALRYHDFDAETGGGNYGREIDLSAQRKFGKRYGLLLKFAMFDSKDAAFDDVTKAWVMLTAGF